ncbi:MAG: hypothetical protein GY700_13490 [Propionibacteriaceae bacterium]|nr:hypothetical protein [Propionibacteriaceae bacterium]
MTVVTANDMPLASVDLYVPHRGAWWARLEFVDAPDIEGSVEIAIDELRLTGTIVPDRDGTHGSHRKCLVFAGAAGWGTEVQPLHYRSDTGVRALLVAEDAARAAGETLGTFEPSQEHMGPHYVRQSGLARRVLEEAIGDVLWWVDYEGVTHVSSERPTVEATEDDYRVLDYDPMERLITLEIRDPRGVIVGSSLAEGIDDPQTVRELTLHASSGGLRMQVWTGEGRYGLADSQAYTAYRRYSDGHLWGSWRYRVTRMTGDAIDARPVLSTHGLPELVGVQLSPGVPGCDVDVPAGLEVLVEFIEGNRAYPRIVAFAGHDQSSWTPTRLTLDAGAIELGDGATKEAARKDDTVEVTIPMNTVIVAVAGGTLNPSPITLNGSITSGSAKTKVE